MACIVGKVQNYSDVGTLDNISVDFTLSEIW